jgi:hypothetical protein
MIRTILSNFRSTAPRLPPSVWDAHGRTLAALAPNNFDCSFCVLECDAFHSFAAFISWISPSKKIDDEIADGGRRRFELGFFLFVFGFDGENGILAVEIDSHFVSFVVGRTVNATSPVSAWNTLAGSPVLRDMACA